MTVSIEALRLEMEAAAAALDFETAGRLRDRISLLRSGGEDVDPAGLERQRPGAMGLGTSQSRVVPPEGWVKPVKPDPMTKRRGR
ncbi:UvrB/UvrC motif-containing protein [Sphingomonas sp. CD22]|uniref:UvrB/UvrC motif-containing protein n=1 Tax=Sphingomonas sp. CD22 TaxID=3100214 RepID=UPI002ADF1570|nr:UvrB/UvrC motif-containing protein [Sphingomonas sp. CD22]MEA1085228.1 UvrB/UvrC motif-containing protein [Sphingomonas sp. CD22]